MKIGVLLYTYDRIDDARINLEIIRSVWAKNYLLKDVTIVHSYNGKEEWWPEKFLENELLYLDNPSHFLGAEILINKGIDYFHKKYPDIDYVIILASDTWLVKPGYIEKIVSSMSKEGKYFATCPWGNPKDDNMWKIGMALDFAIVDIKWAVKNNFFPLRYKEFVEKYNEIFLYKDEVVYPEIVLALRFKQAIMNSVKIRSEHFLGKIANEYIYRIREREPIHDEKKFFRVKKGRKMYWPKIGLITHHEPEPKQKILKKLNVNIGKNADRLIQANDLSYYNQGIRKVKFTKQNKDIGD